MVKRLAVALCLSVLSLTSAQANEEVVKGLYDNAILLLKQGRPDEALKDLERIYKSYPTSEYADEALHRLGMYHLENKQFQAALDSFQNLISSFGDRNMAPDAYYSIGIVYENPDFSAFDYEKADANFARVYNIYRRSSMVDAALLHSGIVRIKLRELENAQQTLRQLVEDYPQSPLAPQALYHLGLVLAQTGEPLQALEHLQRIIDDYDDKEYSSLALRLIHNLYRINVLLPSKPSNAPYNADSAFSTKKFKKVTAIQADHQDNFYLATEEAAGLKVFSSDGTEQQPIANQRNVQSLFVDASGDLFIIRAAAFHLRGQDHTLKRKTPKGLVPINDMLAAVRDANRTLFVKTSSDDSLLQFDKDENFIATFPTTKLGKLEDMAMDKLGNLYLLDGKSEKILKFDFKGALKGAIEKKTSQHEFKDIKQVVTDRAGTLYLLDSKEKKVYLFDADLQLLYVFTPPGLNKPSLMTVDSAGTLYIYDEKENVIRKYL